jgi:hypothetical protein
MRALWECFGGLVKANEELDGKEQGKAAEENPKTEDRNPKEVRMMGPVKEESHKVASPSWV